MAEYAAEQKDVVRVGATSYYSGLFVDEAGNLAKVDPTIDETSLPPSCACCTHTFNGKPFTRRYAPLTDS